MVNSNHHQKIACHPYGIQIKKTVFIFVGMKKRITERTSKKVASSASKLLQSTKTSKKVKSIAGSALRQRKKK
jgi:hypothetical protein